MAEFTAYCDESGQRNYGLKTDRFFVVAGVILPADEVCHLEDELRGLKRAFWGKPDIEILSNWIRREEQRLAHYTQPHGIGLPEINDLICALYRWLPNTSITVVAGVVDKPLMEQTYKDPHYPGTVSYTFFLQRYQLFLANRAGMGSVVFDDPAGKSPGGFEWRDLLPRLHQRLKTYGCPYTAARFPNIGSVTLADSQSSGFIQIADLVAYNTFRQFRDHGKEWEDPRVQQLPMYDHFARIVNLFDLGPGGRLDGYGIAKWPLQQRVAWGMN